MLTLGIDSSTQGTKAVVYDTETKTVVARAAVNYGKDLPAFGSPDGFLPNADARVRRADPRMWVQGLDLVLARLQEAGAPMDQIAAVGGDAQQHATVYLTEEGVDALKTCACGAVEAGFFSRAESPIWMDSSTGAEVAALDAHFGAALQTRTGSPAIERFAASQVMKFRADDPAGWAKTARVHLLSSFLTSYLTGEDAPIETGDGAGMNLLNLQTLDWDEDVCAFVAPDLKAKLPGVFLPGDKPLALAARFEKFGLRAGIPVAPFTGDNPASLVGCGAEEPGCAVISLGTSDTFFAAMRDFKTDPDGFGHVFGNPMGGFMSLSCFKNGSLARERIKKECDVDWTFFDETAFDLTPSGNNGQRAFPYFETEITPKHDATGIEANFDWAAASSETKIRAIVEGQIMNMRERTRWIGDFKKVFVTGGASRSRGIRSVIADVFGAQVETLDVADSAAVGGARLAAKAAGTGSCGTGFAARALCLLATLGLVGAASAAWAPAGELQVASTKVLTPQVGTLAAKANFPMLPMILPQVMAESDLAKKFGVAREDADWGAKLFIEGNECVPVWVWPLPKGGVADWQTKHPKKKIVDGLVTYKHKAAPEEGHDEPWQEFAVFSADGQWAYLSPKKELAQQAAKDGLKFEKPLAKGIARIDLTRSVFEAAAKEMSSLNKQLDEVKKTAAAAQGKKDDEDEEAFSLLPDDFFGKDAEVFVRAWTKEVESLRVIFGVSSHGLDMRARLTPRAGGALTGPSRTLPAEAFAFTDVPESAVITFVGAPVAPKGELGKAWQTMVDGQLAAVRQHFEGAAQKKETADDVAFQSFARMVSFLTKGISAFRASPTPCTYARFVMAEDEKSNKLVEFRAAGLKDPIAFTEKVPELPTAKPKAKKDKKASSQMASSLRNADGVFAIGGQEKGFAPGKTDTMKDQFTKAIPESAQTKTPLFVARYRVGIGMTADAPIMLSAWMFGWRSDEDYRAMLRVPTEEFAKIFQAVLQSAVSGDVE